MRRAKRADRVCTAIPALLLLAGCTSLPSVEPFVGASIQLRSAVAESGAVVAEELRIMEGGAEFADQLDEAWTARLEATDALVAYSDSLQAIVGAGNSGAQSVERLAGSLESLAGGVGLTLTPVAGVVIDVAQKVYAEIAKVRAKKSLTAALESAQPAVELIIDTIAEDIADAREILETANEDIQFSREEALEDRLKFRRKVADRLDQLYRKGSLCSEPNCLTDGERVEMLQLKDLMAVTDTWHQPYQAEREMTAKRLRIAKSLLTAAASATRQWGAAHRQLAVAVKTEQPINPLALVQAALDVKRLVERIRDL